MKFTGVWMVFTKDLLYEIMAFQLHWSFVTYNSNLDWMGIDQRIIMWNYDFLITISFCNLQYKFQCVLNGQ